MTLRYHGHARAGCHHVRRRCIIVRIFGAVEQEDIDASRVRGVEGVGQADVELHVELSRRPGHAHLDGAVGVEAIAAQIEGMKDELEVALGAARLLLERAAAHHVVQHGQVALLGVGEQVAARALQVGLNLAIGVEVALHGAEGGELSEREAGSADQIGRVVAAQRVHVAHGNGGKGRLLLAHVANCGGDLVLAVLDDGVLDEPRAQ